jgi:uncharacterized protein
MIFHSMRKTSSLLILLFVSLVGSAQIDEKEFPPRPNPPRLVNDLADVLSAQQEQELEGRLVAFDDSTSTQIAVVTMKSTGRYAIEDYALYLGRYWQIGQAEMNNGVIILAAIDDRNVTIQVGYGIEPFITDGLAKRIVELDILPAFRQGDYYAGLSTAATSVMGYVTGEFEAVPDEPKAFNWVEFLIMFIIIILLLSYFGRKNKGGGVTYSGRGPTYWGSGGGFGGFGGGGGGGFGGGGFGGFGGGSFGGGGASGSW